MEYTEDINEWQQIEQHSLQTVPTTINPEDGTTSSPSVTSSSVTDDEGATPMPAPSPSPSDWRLRVANEGKKLLKLRFEAMKTGVVRVASKVRNCAICTGAFWSITCVTGAAAAVAVLILFYVGIRSRGRRSVDHSVNLVREKDEKISKLLLQIAQLNEILSSRRKVPVHRIGS